MLVQIRFIVEYNKVVLFSLNAVVFMKVTKKKINNNQIIFITTQSRPFYDLGEIISLAPMHKLYTVINIVNQTNSSRRKKLIEQAIHF